MGRVGGVIRPEVRAGGRGGPGRGLGRVHGGDESRERRGAGPGDEAGPGRGLVRGCPSLAGRGAGRMAPCARRGGCEQRAPGGAGGTGALGPRPWPSPGPAPSLGAAPPRSRKMWGALLCPLLWRLLLLLSPRDGVCAAPQAP